MGAKITGWAIEIGPIWMGVSCAMRVSLLDCLKIRHRLRICTLVRKHPLGYGRDMSPNSPARPSPTTPTVPVIALIVAGGKGLRAGGDTADQGPKQFATLSGQSVLRWSVAAFAAHSYIAAVHVVVPSGYVEAAHDAIAPYSAHIAIGGATRQASVAAGLAMLSHIDDDAIILVHDAARPLLPAAVIDRCIAAFADPHIAGAVPALPVVDTLAVDGAGTLGATVDRNTLARVQTPQAFRLGALRAAHAGAIAQDASDDAQMVRASGGQVRMIEGAASLLKLTYKEDFAMAEMMAAQQMTSSGHTTGPFPAATMRTAVGMGYDVHRLETGKALWLGGIELAHDRGLAGHSDADVALHALTDAILGAIGAGDIGTHFPPSDPQWKGAKSSLFLEHAANLVAEAGGRIDHVDLTIICEAPKIGPHRPAMRTRIANLLRISENHVSVKATTTERLGFTGREEGIAAQAVATVSLPVSSDAANAQKELRV